MLRNSVQPSGSKPSTVCVTSLKKRHFLISEVASSFADFRFSAGSSTCVGQIEIALIGVPLCRYKKVTLNVRSKSLSIADSPDNASSANKQPNGTSRSDCRCQCRSSLRVSKHSRRLADRGNVGNASFDPTNPATAVQVTNPTIRDIRQFVRFDITPGWVTGTFPRVSTVLSNVQMDGLRVPVVTGTSAGDFAGTVDFYFDRMQQPRRIILEGHCGDPSNLARMLLEFYGLQPEPALGGHLYVSRWNNRVTSLAMFQPAPIVHANDPYRKFEVFIEVNQPSLEYGLSEKSEQLLRQAWQNLRWQQ